MENTELQAVLEAVISRLFVPLEASGRHVHITKEQAMTLFGHGLTPKRPLSQPGQYLANERVTLVGPKGQFENVAVLGPERPEGQVEISLTDGRALGITPALRLSGDVDGTPGAILRGNRGQVELRQGVICAKRHIHLTPETAKRLKVRDKQDVKLQVFTDRPLIFDAVTVRVSEKFADFVHLDYDEANACGFRNGDLGRILEEESD
ncbi:MAG: phosphate propanoyltransferase [Oscillospiraceae bacterium]|nr:phosphate propanoyltransferase [Oscillospiraceae bacterium]MBQ9929813.1 phosphate propanoyltransferase [Oscillospiraceae bacterium]